MSGSSLDGLDIVYTLLDENRGAWKFDIQEAECIHYTSELRQELSKASQLDVSAFLKLSTRYGKYIAGEVNAFIARHGLDHKVDFIASHGHTVFHEPANHTTCQIGDGATIAALTGIPVISDLRAMDVALGGQGAPIVPLGDKLLFGSFDYWLNIGGIANITVRNNNDSILAFDICPANQVLNTLANREGLPMDEEGVLAQQGTLLLDVLEQLNNQDYYKRAAPKSLSNEAAIQLVFPDLLESPHSTKDLLRTANQHIADQVAAAIANHPHNKETASLLATGGGAFSNYLMALIQEALVPYKVKVVVPYEQVVKFKEALVMALLGALRWREENNVLSGVTGATKDSIGGALWMGRN